MPLAVSTPAAIAVAYAFDVAMQPPIAAVAVAASIVAAGLEVAAPGEQPQRQLLAVLLWHQPQLALVFRDGVVVLSMLWDPTREHSPNQTSQPGSIQISLPQRAYYTFHTTLAQQPHLPPNHGTAPESWRPKGTRLKSANSGAGAQNGKDRQYRRPAQGELLYLTFESLF